MIWLCLGLYAVASAWWMLVICLAARRADRAMDLAARSGNGNQSDEENGPVRRWVPGVVNRAPTNRFRPRTLRRRRELAGRLFVVGNTWRAL